MTQAVQSEEPFSEKNPAEHDEQLAAPVVEMYVPGPQLEHAFDPEVAVKVPQAQLEHSFKPGANVY